MADGVSDDPTGTDAEMWDLPLEAQQLLEDKKRVIPVIGAGVSASSGLPTAPIFSQALLDRCEHPPGPPYSGDVSDFFAVADYLANDDRQRSVGVHEFVATYWREELASLDATPEARRVPARLVQVPSKMVVTFNYDTLLEQAAQEAAIPFKPISEFQDFGEALDRAKRAASPDDELLIVHLHGIADEPRTIVLDRLSYQAAARNRFLEELVKALMERKRLCFLGSTLDEPGFLDWILNADRQEEPHAFFLTADTQASMNRAKVTHGRHNIRPFVLPTHDHMRGVVRHLARGRNAEANLSRVEFDQAKTVIAAQAEDHYVAAVVEEITEESDRERFDYLGLKGDGRHLDRWKSDTTQEVFEDERKLANGHRDLLLGVPGAGKSQLLVKAAEFVPDDSYAVLVRLAGVATSGAADATTRLKRWLREAKIDVNENALDAETFHFFLDGLDEVHPELQPSVAQAITEMARAYPQHSFTVSSRPVGATDLFSKDEWRYLELAQGSTWRTRYLAQRGTKLDALLDGRRDTDSLVALLNIPFFLVRAVDLFERGELAGLDAWGLLQRFVDDRLAEEEGELQLPVSTDVARSWLRCVALSMRLSGVMSLNVEELAEFPLGDGGSTSHDTVREALIQRTMLQDVAPEFSFIHRIIGEFLVAEALLETEPTESLLNGVAPILDGGYSGVSPDWLVPLSLSLSQSSEWRKATRARDELHWARSVPTGADLDERRAAAELLWSTYCGWGVWIWDREKPDLVQDGAALSRLLAQGDLTEVVEAVHQGLDDASAQVQSNAIVVLAGARLEGLQGDLRRILDDDSREAVVRRYAALAARDLGLTDLLDLIVFRATHPAADDQTEAQDCSSAALGLAPEERLLGVAKELLDHEESRMVLMSRLDDLFGPEQALEVLRNHAERVEDPYMSEKGMVLDAIEALSEPSEDVVENAVFCAASWEMADQEVLALIADYSEPALRAIRDATDEARGGWWWHGALLVEQFGADDLEEAGLNEQIVERKRQLEAREALMAEEDAVPGVSSTGLTQEEGLDEPEDPKLIQLLANERTGEQDAIIQYYAQNLAGELESLSGEEREDLSNRLDEWWPSGRSFSEAVVFTGEGKGSRSWTIENWANAWSWYGPKLAKQLAPDRWAQLMLSGIVFEDQDEWLRDQATDSGVRCLVGVEKGRTVEDWYRVARIVPGTLPASLVERLVQDLEKPPLELGYDFRAILNRLADEQQLDALKALQKNDLLQAAVTPYLASAGDDEAIAAEFETLKVILAEGKRPDREALHWLSGAKSSDWLPDLFETLRLASVRDATEQVEVAPEGPAHDSEDEDGIEVSAPDGPRRRQRGRRARSAGFQGFIETPSVLIEKIAQIGGVEAVRRYDELLAEDYEYRFLRLSRDRLMESQLQRRAADNSNAAATELNLPLFSVPDDDGLGDNVHRP